MTNSDALPVLAARELPRDDTKPLNHVTTTIRKSHDEREAAVCIGDAEDADGMITSGAWLTSTVAWDMEEMA
jgi:hypothetical protein